LVTCRNLAAEAAYEIFDMETMESVCFKNPDSHNRVLHCPAKKNPDAHLHLFELSLLFGGHCMKKEVAEDPVDQVCHCDVDGLQDPETIKLFNNNQMPGSFIVPLEDHRTMCHSTPQNLTPVKRGQLLWFDGAMAHGGTTCKATQEGNDWYPALHCHLDSNKFPGVKGCFQHKQSKCVYFPDEHLQFERNIGEPLVSAETTLGLLVEQICTGSASASGGKEHLRGLTPEQKKCCNQVLRAPCQPNKTVELETDPEQLHQLLHNAVLRLQELSSVALSWKEKDLKKFSKKKKSHVTAVMAQLNQINVSNAFCLAEMSKRGNEREEERKKEEKEEENSRKPSSTKRQRRQRRMKKFMIRGEWCL
jgi:hypothetical protein